MIAKSSLRSYVEHCHPFMPIVDISRSEAFEYVQQSPPLMSSITAIASRFYSGYSDRVSGSDRASQVFSHTLSSNASLSAALAEIAENHLSDILLHKRHALADVQAILLMAAWGLRSGGGGPDAWMISGHASRVAIQLGLHQLVSKTMHVESLPDDGGSRKIDKIESITRQWRTWLCGAW